MLLTKVPSNKTDSFRVTVGTKNKAKCAAVRKVFESLFPSALVEFVYVDAPSLVSDQPISDEETIKGATNRADNAMTFTKTRLPCNEDTFDLSLGLEGGVREIGSVMYACNWVALRAREGPVFIAGGAQFPLPTVIADEIRKGIELGVCFKSYANSLDITDFVGAVDVLTAHAVDRVGIFEHIVKLALGQWVFWKDTNNDFVVHCDTEKLVSQ